MNCLNLTLMLLLATEITGSYLTLEQGESSPFVAAWYLTSAYLGKSRLVATWLTGLNLTFSKGKTLSLLAIWMTCFNLSLSR